MTEPKAVITHRMTFEGQTFNVTVREGAYEEMIRDTLNHFIVAVRYLKKGIFEQPESKWCKREEYNANFAHADAQVCVFGDVDVLFRERTVRVSINKCLETTSAWDIICLAIELCKATWIDTPEDTHQQSAQEWADSPTPEKQTPSVQSVSDSGTLNLGKWDSRQKDEYAKYAGQVVSFEIAAIKPKYADNGTPYYTFLPYINNSIGQYPIYGMNVYSDNEKTPQAVKDVLTPIKSETHANWRVVCRIVLKEDKLVYYVQKIEAKG